MEAYAVIETGGKQYRVQNNDVFDVEKLIVEPGKKVDFDTVLAVSDGKELTVGTPTVKGAKVQAEVVEHLRADKVTAFKRKRRQGYKRRMGHRQEMTKIKIIKA